MKKATYLFTIFILLWISLISVFAGTTGKISGIIRDSDSGEPLAGANIIVDGVLFGASSDGDGFYFIINIPPGTYSVEASYIGYKSVKKVQVRVVTDMTSKLDFKLSSTLMETEAVVVIAEKPAIQKDLTSSHQSFSGDEIEGAPVEDLTQMMEIQSGISMGDEEERASIIRDTPGDGLHIRGGRENETVYLVDGVRIDNPIWGGADYTQNTSGSSVTEMMTILGTFNAEYGGKMSGVINLITKEGSNKFSAKFSGYTDKFGIEEFDRNTFQGDLTLSGPVPFLNNIFFFVNTQYRTTDGRFSGYKIDNWTDFKGKVPIEDENGNPIGEEVAADWKDQRNSLIKLTWRVNPNLKLMTSYMHSEVIKIKYKHDYKYLPESMPWSSTTTDGITLKSNCQFNAFTFADLLASYQSVDYWMGIHEDRVQRIVLGSRHQEDIYGFNYSGASNNYWRDESKTFQLKFSATSQINNVHLLKAGFDYRYLDLFHRLENAWDSPIDELVVGSDPETGELIKEVYQSHKAFSHSKPLELAGFIQDKMEFENMGMIVNAGLRFERWSIDKKYMQDPENPMETPLLKTDPKVRFSPRLGVSYPISDKSAFHFAYGHFYQYPSYVDLLSGVNEEGQYPDRPNLQDIGLAIFNPNINPEKSVTYEAGVQTYLMQDLTLNVTAYYKEMADLVGVTWIQNAGYVYFDNVDFGQSKGLEFTLTKRFSNKFSVLINYSLSQTKISTSSPMTAAQTVSTSPIAYVSYLADWDRPHNLSASIQIEPMKKWKLSFKAKYKSGKPYSVLAEQRNTERMPSYIKVDMKLSKKFNFFGLSESIYLRIHNLFDRENVYSVYKITGKWNDDGDPGTPPAKDANPRRRSDGRRVLIGMNIAL